MTNEAHTSPQLLTIDIPGTEVERISAASINTRIAASSALAILVKPEALEREIPLKEALSLLSLKAAPEMIIFSDASWPLLFTRKAWEELQGISHEGVGAKSILSAFVASARKTRRFTVLQINR